MGYTPPYLEVRRLSATATGVYSPSGTAGDDLLIYANTTDTAPSLQMYGGSVVYLVVPNGAYLSIINGADEVLRFSGTALTGGVLESITADVPLYLKTNGTGKVKFGTWTASGDVAVNGSVAILDALGNARKLATIA